MIIQKMVVAYKDWNDMLPYILNAYHTIIRTYIGVTFYFLVKIISLRVLMDAKLEESEGDKNKI